MAETEVSPLRSKLSAVEMLIDAGLMVFLVNGIKEGCCTCGKQDCSKAGKHPLHGNGVYSASKDKDYLKAQLVEQPWANLAVAMGRGSDCIALDLDTPGAIEKAEANGLPPTWDFSTGKGRQVLFKYPDIRKDRAVTNAVRVTEGMDIRSDGGYSIVPPSLHASGRFYQWLHDPTSGPLAEVPEWLMDILLVKPLGEAAEAEVDKPQELIGEGERNQYLFKTGCYWRAKGCSEEELLELLIIRNRNYCNPPLSMDEIQAVTASVVQRYSNQEKGTRAKMAKEVEKVLGNLSHLPDDLFERPLTDSGNGECLALLFHENFRACKAISDRKADSKGMLRFNGRYWEPDLTRQFRDRAKWTARARGIKASEAATKQLHGQIARWAIQSESLGKLEAACELAASDERLIVPESIWDANPMLLGLLNGTLDLTTGKVREPDKDDYITQVAAVSFDEKATCLIWEETLASIFQDNPEIVPYLQRVFGYCLSGLTSEHVMWFFFGTGANGKSTLLNTILSILGGFGATVGFSTFDEKGEAERNDSLAGLRSKRLVVTTEGERGRKLAEAKIKAVVSDDAIRCRFLHNNFFEYHPTYKVILATNHLPEIRSTDMGIWRRVHMVPFHQTFEGDRRDIHLDLKLRREAPGILNWLIKGFQMYQKEGLNPPDIVLASTKTLRESNDTFAAWVESRLERTGTPRDLLQSSAGFTDYRGFMRGLGEQPATKVAWEFNCQAYGLTFDQKARTGPYAIGWKLQDQDLFGH